MMPAEGTRAREDGAAGPLTGALPGPSLLDGRRCRFSVWAPGARRAELRIVHPYEKTLPLLDEGMGLLAAEADNVEPGVRYVFRVDGADLPDPASRRQPEGPEGPSEVVDPRFWWTEAYWCGLPLQDLVLYELHIAAFTPEGTLSAAAAPERLRALKDLGVTALLLLPVMEHSPGDRDWGYGSPFPYSVDHRYGEPADLKRLVDSAHRLGMAVVLDLPFSRPSGDGGCLPRYGPYLRGPGCAGYNLDGADSDEARGFLLGSARMWLEEFRVDALRLRRADELEDRSPFPFLEELGEAVHAFSRASNRLCYLLAHSARNDARLVRQRELGGLGLDAVADADFQHALWALLSGERLGVHQDFGRLSDLAKAYAEGFVFTGQRSDHLRRRHGTPSASIPPRRLLVCSRDHEAVADGGRSAGSLSYEALKLAAGAVLLSPYLPLVFMGEEYAETAPFERPLDERAATRCRLDWSARAKPKPSVLAGLHAELLRLRRTHPALKDSGRERPRVVALEDQDTLLLVREGLFAALHFGDLPLAARLPVPPGNWSRLVDSSDERWGGGGSASPAAVGVSGSAAMTLQPKSFVVYEKRG